MNYLKLKESPFPVSALETAAIVATVPTSWGTATLTSLSSTLYEDPDGANTDRTATMLTGSTTASGQVITTAALTGLTAGLKYRIDVVFTTDEGDTLAAFAIIYAQR